MESALASPSSPSHVELGLTPSQSALDLSAAIERLQAACQITDDDPGRRMQQVDWIQDQLNQQLDDLDARLQTEIARLTAQRQAADPAFDGTHLAPVAAVAGESLEPDEC
jgi:uncharacterized small protein (DUF1192 family)